MWFYTFLWIQLQEQKKDILPTCEDKMLKKQILTYPQKTYKLLWDIYVTKIDWCFLFENQILSWRHSIGFLHT